MWTVETRQDRLDESRTYYEFTGPQGDQLEFGLTVPTALAAATWGGEVKTRPEVAEPTAEWDIDTDATPVAGTVRIVITLDTSDLAVGEDYHADLWFEQAGDVGPTTIMWSHLHTYQRISELPA